MIKIAHLASYGINAGDNIASYNIRKRLNEIVDQKIEWSSVNILPFHDVRNNVEYSKNLFKKVSEENDLLIVGGGGLIEGEHKFETYYKLPFNADVLSVIDIPMVAFAVGVNNFRNRNRMTREGLHNIKAFIDRCELFSVRNDGSQETISNYFNNMQVPEVPDPGLIFGFEADQKETIKNGLFQPAWNSGDDIIAGRGLFPANLEKVSNFIKELDLKTIPHCPKDYKFPQIPTESFQWNQQEFNELIKYDNFMKIFKTYYDYDYGIVMRGHGQLCSVGLNLPSIYFSTQDKVLGFSLKNGFEDYNVDIRQSNWDQLIYEKVNKLKNDKDYLSNWYDIRNRNMKQYQNKFDDYCFKIRDILQK